MLIKSITIENYRCIRKLTIQVEQLTAFVGRNGSGKSTILNALAVFYNTKALISLDDFYDCDPSLVIQISVEYCGLNALERTEFAPYLNGDSLAVRKTVFFDGGNLSQHYYATTQQIPQIAAIRRLSGVTDRREAWNSLIDQNDGLPELGPRSKRGDNLDELMLTYETAHPELAEWTPQEVQFFGPPNVGGGKLDNFTKFVFVPAGKDVTADLADKKGTALNQLLEFLVMRRFRARADVRQLQAEFTEKLTQLYSPATLTEFGSLAQDISKTLNLYVPSAHFDLDVSTPKLPDIPIPATSPTLVEDGFSGPIDRKGHGLQRALIFAMLQHLAVAKPIDVESEEAETNSASTQVESSLGAPDVADALVLAMPDLIIAIEEPELYQHPLRARHLANVLTKMSKQGVTTLGGKNQILYCTHSPYFVSLEQFDQIRVVRKQTDGSSNAPCTRIAEYSLSACSSKMERLTDKPSGTFSAESFRSRTYPIMTTTVGEGFFAEAVVLVEGLTEVAALRAVSEQMRRDWLSLGIAVIAVEGKSKLDRPAVVFSGFEIPTYVVFDGDAKMQADRQDPKCAIGNRLLLRLCGGCEVDFPPTTVAQRYACFERDFEHYCRDTLSEEVYERVLADASRLHGYEKPSEGIKNYDVIMDFVATLYSEGLSLPILEQIVEQVSALVECSPLLVGSSTQDQLQSTTETIDAFMVAA